MSIKNFVKKNMARINHWKNAATDPGPKLAVLLYHRVLPGHKNNRLNTVVSEAAFEKQLDRLSRKYRIVSLKDAVSGSGADKLSVALTFDDGYWDNYEIVFPILKKKGLSAVFFLPIDHIDGKAKFDDSRLFDKRSGRLHDLIDDRFMTWDQARAMSDAGMEIGSHGVSHRSLSRMPAGEARREIADSKRIIEQNTKKPCDHFSFPFGARTDYNNELIKCVKDAGFRSCVLNVHGYNHFDEENFCFKRMIMDEFTDIDFILG